MRRLAAVALAVSFGAIDFAVGGGPPPMYVICNKVRLEPNDKSPTRIRIDGVFLRTKPGEAYQFDEPKTGYVYFGLPASHASEARGEWKLWQKAAGTGKAVALGSCGSASRFLTVPIHKSDEKAANVDGDYPLNQLKIFGVLYYDETTFGKIDGVTDLIRKFGKKGC